MCSFRCFGGNGTFSELTLLQRVDSVAYAHQKYWDLSPWAVGDWHVCSLTQTAQSSELSQHHRQFVPIVSELLPWESAFLFLWRHPCFWYSPTDLTRKQRSLFSPHSKTWLFRHSCPVPSRVIVRTSDNWVLKYRFSWPAHSCSFHLLCQRQLLFPFLLETLLSLQSLSQIKFTCLLHVSSIDEVPAFLAWEALYICSR